MVMLRLIFLPSYYPIICLPCLGLATPYFVAGARRWRKARALDAAIYRQRDVCLPQGGEARDFPRPR